MGIPASFIEPSEIKHMLAWLPHLDKLFPEAVDLAIKMPPMSLEQSFIVSNIKKSDLWENYPESVAKLLVYLGDCGIPDYEWYETGEMFERVLQSNITQETKEKLKELNIRLRIT